MNAQMGPLADLRVFHENGTEDTSPQIAAIKWLDNNQNDKVKLITNKSEDDLIYKENPGVVDNHKAPTKKPSKRTIKKFQINLSDVTGVQGMQM